MQSCGGDNSVPQPPTLHSMIHPDNNDKTSCCQTFWSTTRHVATSGFWATALRLHAQTARHDLNMPPTAAGDCRCSCSEGVFPRSLQNLGQRDLQQSKVPHKPDCHSHDVATYGLTPPKAEPPKAKPVRHHCVLLTPDSLPT